MEVSQIRVSLRFKHTLTETLHKKKEINLRARHSFEIDKEKQTKMRKAHGMRVNQGSVIVVNGEEWERVADDGRMWAWMS